MGNGWMDGKANKKKPTHRYIEGGMGEGDFSSIGFGSNSLYRWNARECFVETSPISSSTLMLYILDILIYILGELPL